MAIDKKELETKSKRLLIYMITVLEALRNAQAKTIKAREKELRDTIPLPLGKDNRRIHLGDELVREDGSLWKCTGVMYHEDGSANLYLNPLAANTPASPFCYPPSRFSHAKRKNEDED